MKVEGETYPPFQHAGPAVRVGYGQDAINSLMTDVIGTFATGPVASSPTSSGFWDAVNFCMPRLAHIKHEAFKYEREWRLIVSRYGGKPVNDVDFRYGVRLIPYIKLTFEPADVSDIYIGPGSNFPAVRALRAFLRIKGYDVNTVSIEQSDAPYRDAEMI